MTPAEIQAEWHHRYQTRLGILASDQQPTRDQINLAAKEADEWEEKYREENPTE